MRLFLHIALFFFLSFPAVAELSVSVSKTALTEGESFQLRLRQDEGDIKADISPIYKDFSLIGQQSSSQTTIINGTALRKNELILTLIPKKTGEIELPSLKAGKEKTKPIKITVSEAGTGTDANGGDKPSLFLRAEIGDESPYLAQQVPYTVRLYVPDDADLLEGAFTPPSAEGVVVEQHGNGRRFVETQNGKKYSVIEYAFLLFPQKTGKIALTPAGFRGVVSDPFARGRSDRTQFSFGGFTMFRDERNILLRTKPVTLNVRPAASAGAWLPARSVSVKETVSPSSGSVAVGDTVTRTVTVQASGVRDSQLPDPVFPETADFKQYPGQSETGSSFDDKGIVGLKTRQIVFMPVREGSLTLPPLEYEWFDVKAKKTRKATLPARTITVVRSEKSVLPQSEPVAGVQKDRPVDALPEKTVEPDVRQTPVPSSRSFVSGALCGFAAALVVLLLLLLPGRRKRKGENARTDDTSVRFAEKAFKNACKGNDPSATGKALLMLAAAIFKDDPPSTLSVVADRIGDAALSKEIAALNAAVYSGRKDACSGKALWDAYKAAGAKIRKTAEREKSPLPPLYPE